VLAGLMVVVSAIPRRPSATLRLATWAPGDQDRAPVMAILSPVYISDLAIDGDSTLFIP